MKIFLLMTGLSFLIMGCDGDSNVSKACSATNINKEQYINAGSDPYDIKEVLMVDGCLKVSIMYGGGCGESSASLVDSGGIIETNPIQRKVRLLFSDNDDCEALIKKDFYFDVTNLKVENENKVLLNFLNTNITFLYEY